MRPRALLRTLARGLFRLSTALAAATAALSLWTLVPVLAAGARGGSAGWWVFGSTGLVAGAAWAWLAVAATLWWRRRALRARPPA